MGSTPLFSLIRSPDYFSFSKNQPFNLFINSTLFLFSYLFLVFPFENNFQSIEKIKAITNENILDLTTYNYFLNLRISKKN